MSTPCWYTLLTQQLRLLSAADTTPRVAVIGMGNRLLGDDAVGSIIARALRWSMANQPHRLCLDVGLGLESYTGPILRFHPALLLLTDAANLGMPAGTIRLLAPSSTVAGPTSTHTQSLIPFAQYIRAQNPCHILLLGIQPASTLPGQRLSPAVRHSARQIVQQLQVILASDRSPA